VWLDALTPKQLLFLAAVGAELEARGAEVLLTTRHYEELDALEARLGLSTVKVGSHGGGDLRGKLEASLRRSLELHGMVADFGPDLALATASPEAARISYGLGIPLLAFNDSPHSVAVARLVVPLASRLYSPWLIRRSDWLAAGVIPAAYAKYRSLDPMAWLLRRDLWPPREPWEDARGAIVVRAGESRAYYYGGGVDAAELARRLARDYPVVLLSRYSEGEVGDGVRAVGPGFFGPNVLEGALAFVGLGGTMSQEALLMGVPTVSAYPGEYRIEAELVRRGLMLKAGGTEEAVELVRRAVEEGDRLRARASAFRGSLVDPAAFAAEEAVRFLEGRGASAGRGRSRQEADEPREPVPGAPGGELPQRPQGRGALGPQGVEQLVPREGRPHEVHELAPAAPPHVLQVVRQLIGDAEVPPERRGRREGPGARRERGAQLGRHLEEGSRLEPHDLPVLVAGGAAPRDEVHLPLLALGHHHGRPGDLAHDGDARPPVGGRYVQYYREGEVRQHQGPAYPVDRVEGGPPPPRLLLVYYVVVHDRYHVQELRYHRRLVGAEGAGAQGLVDQHRDEGPEPLAARHCVPEHRRQRVPRVAPEEGVHLPLQPRQEPAELPLVIRDPPVHPGPLHRHVVPPTAAYKRVGTQPRAGSHKLLITELGQRAPNAAGLPSPLRGDDKGRAAGIQVPRRQAAGRELRPSADGDS